MSSSKISVLLVGATGTLGAHIAQGFLSSEYAPKVQLGLLVRRSTAETAGAKKAALEALVAKGATLVFGDIDDEEATLVKALSGYQVLVSAVSQGQLGAPQVKLFHAAKAANVRWVVPSEFGYDAAQVGRNSVVPIFDAKILAGEALKATGLDYTYISTGAFAEYVVSPFFGVDLAAGTITAPGSFDSQTAITPLADIGLQVADAVVTGRGKNQHLNFGLGPVTYGQLATALEKVTGKKLERKVLTVAEAEAAIKKNEYDYAARFAVLIAQQSGKRTTTWNTADTYAAKNGLKYQSLEEALTKIVAGGK